MRTLLLMMLRKGSQVLLTASGVDLVLASSSVSTILLPVAPRVSRQVLVDMLLTDCLLYGSVSQAGGSG